MSISCRVADSGGFYSPFHHHRHHHHHRDGDTEKVAVLTRALESMGRANVCPFWFPKRNSSHSQDLNVYTHFHGGILTQKSIEASTLLTEQVLCEIASCSNQSVRCPEGSTTSSVHQGLPFLDHSAYNSIFHLVSLRFTLFRGDGCLGRCYFVLLALVPRHFVQTFYYLFATAPSTPTIHR